jgi:hypothetical protein
MLQPKIETTQENRAENQIRQRLMSCDLFGHFEDKDEK